MAEQRSKKSHSSVSMQYSHTEIPHPFFFGVLSHPPGLARTTLANSPLLGMSTQTARHLLHL